MLITVHSSSGQRNMSLELPNSRAAELTELLAQPYREATKHISTSLEGFPPLALENVSLITNCVARLALGAALLIPLVNLVICAVLNHFGWIEQRPASSEADMGRAIQRVQLEEQLNEWVNSIYEKAADGKSVNLGKKRQDAKARILKCFDDRSDWLNLRSLQLSDLPDVFLQLTQLKYLELNHNHLEKLPYSLTDLPALEALDLYHNFLKILPCDLGNFSQLKELNLAKNPLISLPNSFFDLPKECRIDLGANPFSPEYVQQIREISQDHFDIVPSLGAG